MARRPNDGRGRNAADGYVLFGIVIAIVILGIFMVAAVPLWQKVVQREREQELIFRGYQYMQAIERYQRKYPGAYPPTVDILVEQKFLRKAYPDPMTPDGKWNILRQLSPELQPGAQAQNAGQQAGITPLNRSQARLQTPGGAPGSTRQPAPTGGRFQSSLGRGPSDQSAGGIVGVASRSTEKTFYQVPGKEKYKDWLFVWGAQQMAVPVPGAVGAPGQVGQQQAFPGQTGAPGLGQRPGQSSQNRTQGQGAFGKGGTGGMGGMGGMGGGTGQVPGQQQQQNRSPFPGLPPPPSLTMFGFGGTGAIPGQIPGQQGLPGSQQPGGFSGQGGNFSQPGQGMGQGQQQGFGSSTGGMQPRPQRPQQRRQPELDE